MSNLVATYLLLIIENLRSVISASKCSFICFLEIKSRGFKSYFSCKGVVILNPAVGQWSRGEGVKNILRPALGGLKMFYISFKGV